MKVDLATLSRQTGRMRKKRFVARAIVPTKAQETDLLRIYMQVVRGWQTEWFDRIRPEYEATLGELLRDSPADVENASETAGAALNRLTVALGADLERWVLRVEQWHRGQFGKAFTPVGVNLDTVLGLGDVRPTLQAVLAENVSLIRSLNDELRNKISGSVFRGLQNRTPAREVAREIRKAAALGQRRAELIAADQLAKISSRLDQERQEQVGLTKFEWQHSGKLHPREEHKARDGKVYAWASPVGRDDPPGRAIRCGCRSRGVLDLDDSD